MKRKFIIINTGTNVIGVPDIDGSIKTLKEGDVDVFGVIPQPMGCLKIKEEIDGKLKSINIFAEYKKQEYEKCIKKRKDKLKEEEEKTKRNIVKIEDLVGIQKKLPIKK